MSEIEQALLLEDIVDTWLRETEMGRSLCRDDDIEKTKDAVFELLNAGFVKVIWDGETACIEPRSPPEPPTEPIRRVKHLGN